MAATFREIDLLREVWLEARRHELRPFACIQSMLANKWLEHPKGPGHHFMPEDFMPEAKPLDDRTPAEKLEDQKIAIFNALSMAAAVNGVN